MLLQLLFTCETNKSLNTLIEFAVKNIRLMKEKWSSLKVSAIKIFIEPQETLMMTPNPWNKIKLILCYSLVPNPPDLSWWDWDRRCRRNLICQWCSDWLERWSSGTCKEWDWCCYRWSYTQERWRILFGLPLSSF